MLYNPLPIYATTNIAGLLQLNILHAFIAAGTTCLLTAISSAFNPRYDLLKFSSAAIVAFFANSPLMTCRSLKVAQVLTGAASGAVIGTLGSQIPIFIHAAQNNPNATTEIACRHSPRVACPRV